MHMKKQFEWYEYIQRMSNERIQKKKKNLK